MTTPTASVLVIEDELRIRRFLRPAFEAAGIRMIEAESGSDGLLQATQSQPDLIVLDLGLPDMEGLTLIPGLREWYRRPILVLSARGQETDKVNALDAGADDYIQKPFSVAELMARIRVALRRNESIEKLAAEPLRLGELTIDLARRDVRRNDKSIHLTPLEFKLLAALVRRAGMVLTHRQLLQEVWGPGHTEEAHYLRLFMHQLRQKLEENPARPQYFLTEAGVGYRFRVN